MANETMESIYARFPWIHAVDQACDQFDRGEAVTVHCPKCGTLLHVKDVLNLARWVVCETQGCVVVHYKKSGAMPTE